MDALAEPHQSSATASLCSSWPKAALTLGEFDLPRLHQKRCRGAAAMVLLWYYFDINVG